MFLLFDYFLVTSQRGGVKIKKGVKVLIQAPPTDPRTIPAPDESTFFFLKDEHASRTHYNHINILKSADATPLYRDVIKTGGGWVPFFFATSLMRQTTHIVLYKRGGFIESVTI